MAKRVTQWRPDTCGCVLHMEWDDEQPAAERTFTAVGHEDTSKCELHAGSRGHAAHLKAVTKHNKAEGERRAKIEG